MWLWVVAQFITSNRIIPGVEHRTPLKSPETQTEQNWASMHVQWMLWAVSLRHGKCEAVVGSLSPLCLCCGTLRRAHFELYAPVSHSQAQQASSHCSSMKAPRTGHYPAIKPLATLYGGQSPRGWDKTCGFDSQSRKSFFTCPPPGSRWRLLPPELIGRKEPRLRTTRNLYVAVHTGKNDKCIKDWCLRCVTFIRIQEYINMHCGCLENTQIWFHKTRKTSPAG